MEIALRAPKLHWRAVQHRYPNSRRKPKQDKPDDLPTAEQVRCTATLAEQERQLPCTLELPASDTKEYEEFLEMRVTFDVYSKYGGEKLISTYSLPLRGCVPVLTEAKVSWSEGVTWNQTELELHVDIPVVTSRQPRELVQKLISYKRRGNKLAEQLSLHRNAVAIGLFPPLLGCFIGVAATSPVWVPLTLFVAIIGSPLWFVIATGLSLVIVFATVSTLVTVQFVRSKRLKSEAEKFLQGPHGQLLLFKGASPDEGKLKHLVMSDPKYKLLASIVIDFLGTATFALPVIGELGDIFWAPLAASMISSMYSQSSPRIKYFAFLEEILPFTDIIPTATLAWMKENMSMKQMREMLKTLGESGGKRAHAA